MSEQDPSEDALLRLLIGQTRDLAVILLTPEGRVRGWLGAAEAVFGWPADEIVGQPVDVLFTSGDRALGLPAWEREVATQAGRSEDDRWHLRRDGIAIWSSGSTLALRDAQGRVQGFAKLVRDRTDQRMRIEALETRLKAQAAEHGGRQILQAEMAHELRNLLTPLFNASYLLRLNPAASSLGQPLETIERQLPALRRLADDLAALGRPGRERKKLCIEALNLTELLRGVAVSLQPEFEAQGLTLELLAPPAPIRIEMDGARFQQMMLNLLGNAVRYTPRGGRVWLKASVEGPDAVVRVQDDGMGIAADQMPRIFELFTRSPTAEDKAPEGQGIGLALVKELAELHEGTVEVRSEGPGRGSEFTLRLPLHGPAQATTPPAAA